MRKVYIVGLAEAERESAAKQLLEQGLALVNEDDPEAVRLMLVAARPELPDFDLAKMSMRADEHYASRNKKFDKEPKQYRSKRDRRND